VLCPDRCAPEANRESFRRVPVHFEKRTIELLEAALWKKAGPEIRKNCLPCRASAWIGNPHKEEACGKRIDHGNAMYVQPREEHPRADVCEPEARHSLQFSVLPMQVLETGLKKNPPFTFNG